MTDPDAATRGRRSRILSFAVVCAAAVVTAVAGPGFDSDRLGPNLLLAGVYLAGLAVGAVFFTVVQTLSGARWSESLRTVPESLPSMLPVALVLLLLVFVGWPETYSWTVETQPGLRGAWLSRPFFIARSVAYLGLWMLSARLLVRQHGSPRVAAGVLVVGALTGWLAAGDWLMSLTPQWASTVFGAYVYVGFIVSALAAMLMAGVALRARRPAGLTVSPDQLRDLATLLFGFSCLWMYLWYCQYMLLWYTNQPHETAYYVLRTSSDWSVLFFATVAFKWAVPFVLLLGRNAKRSLVVLGLAAASSLLGQWLDLYVMIFPSVVPELPRPGLTELGVALGIGAVCKWVLRDRAPSRNPAVAGQTSRASSIDGVRRFRDLHRLE